MRVSPLMTAFPPNAEVRPQCLYVRNVPQPNVREPKVCSLISVLSQSEYIQIMSNNHIAFVSVPDFIQQLTLRVRKRC